MLRKLKAFLFQNQSIRQTVAKNTIWLFSGQIFARLIRAGIIIYAARILGATSWGAFSYALSLAALFTMFIDFGINAVITRESSRDLSLQEKYFSTAFVIKLIAIAAAAVILVVFSPYFIKENEIKILVPIIILIIAFDGLRDLGLALSRAWEKMQIEAFVQILTSSVIVAAGFLALYLSKTSKALLSAYALGTLIGMIIAFYPFRHYLKNIAKSFSRELIKPLLAASWPFGMLGIMGAVMLNTDILMIGWFETAKDVGFYAAGQKIAQLMYIIPTLVAIAFFPSMAKLVAQKELFRTLLEKSMALLALIAIPLSVGGFLLSKEIIRVLYGAEYLPSTLSFMLMNLTYLPVFFSAVLGNAMFAFNREKKLFTYVILGIFGNFLFNLLFIPIWSIAGAALSTIINQIIITTYLFRKLKKDIQFSIFPKIGKIILASLIMTAFVLFFSSLKINVLLIIIFAVLIYFLVLVALKEGVVVEVRETFKKSISQNG